MFRRTPSGAVLPIDALYLFIYSLSMPTSEKPLEWIGSSYKDLMDLPDDARRLFGFALSLAQSGDKHDANLPNPKCQASLRAHVQQLASRKFAPISATESIVSRQSPLFLITETEQLTLSQTAF